MRTYEFSIGAAESGLRLDRYLTRHLPTSVSRAMVQRTIRQGLIMVRGRPVKAHARLRSGDVVTARFEHLPAPARDIPLEPQPIPLAIVYEDDHLLIVDKPAGLVTHPAPGHWDGTLVNAILWHLHRQAARGSGLGARGNCPEPPAQNPEPALPRAGIVHRLDKDTSGLLLVAKTEAAHHLLSRQLKARRIARRYVAIVEGHPPLDSGTVNAPIARHPTHRKVMAVRHLGGRLAVTHYRVVKRFGRALRAQGSGLGARAQPAPAIARGGPGSPEPRAQSEFPYAVLDISLETGRTHQIRVHVAHLGHPVVGDTTYGRRPRTFWETVGVTRQLLHAYRLEFQHPVTGATVVVAAPLPQDMTRWVGDAARDLLKDGAERRKRR